MRKLIIIACILCSSIFALGEVQQKSEEVVDAINEIKVDVWLKNSPSTRKAKLYGTIGNQTSQPLTLVGITAMSAANFIKIYELTTVNNVEQVREIEGDIAISIPARSKIEFRADGMYAELIDLKQDFRSGDKVDITLQFQEVNAHKVQVEVK